MITITRKFMLCCMLCVSLAPNTYAQSASPVVTDIMNQVFALAEEKLPEIFSGGAETLTFEQFVYRLYPDTSVYLAFAEGAVLLLGGPFGESVVNVGPISDVLATLETFETPIGSDLPSDVTLWNLTVSGSFGTSIIANLDFPPITLEGVPAPELEDFDAINEEINTSFEGLATGITAVSITVVNNTPNQRTFDVSFNAQLPDLGTVTYELRYDYTR